jgi:hypothetical protein
VDGLPGRCYHLRLRLNEALPVWERGLRIAILVTVSRVSGVMKLTPLNSISASAIPVDFDLCWVFCEGLTMLLSSRHHSTSFSLPTS